MRLHAQEPPPGSAHHGSPRVPLRRLPSAGLGLCGSRHEAAAGEVHRSSPGGPGCCAQLTPMPGQASTDGSGLQPEVECSRMCTSLVVVCVLMRMLQPACDSRAVVATPSACSRRACNIIVCIIMCYRPSQQAASHLPAITTGCQSPSNQTGRYLVLSRQAPEGRLRHNAPSKHQC